jgi:hypothetical protein
MDSAAIATRPERETPTERRSVALRMIGTKTSRREELATRLAAWLAGYGENQ